MSSNGRRAVIMAGGRGTRLEPYSSVLPKPLVPVNGKPVLEHLLEQLRRHGFTRITLCAGYLAELVQAYFGDGEKLGVEIEYVIESDPMGTIGALRLIDSFEEPALVLNADILMDLDFSALYTAHLGGAAALTIVSCARNFDLTVGVVEFNGSREVTSFREKPRMSFWVCMGAYVASPEILGYLPAAGPVGVDDLVSELLKVGRAPAVFPYDGEWQDLATVADYERNSEGDSEGRRRLGDTSSGRDSLIR